MEEKRTKSECVEIYVQGDGETFNHGLLLF